MRLPRASAGTIFRVPAVFYLGLACNFPGRAARSCQPSEMPVTTDAVLGLDEVWWQVKFVGLDGNDQPTTPFSDVISSPNVPD